jgi:DNA-binding response OmpR family regulator
MKVLIIQDEPKLSASSLILYERKLPLRNSGRFLAVIDRIIDFQYDCVIIDIGSPGWERA